MWTIIILTIVLMSLAGILLGITQRFIYFILPTILATVLSITLSLTYFDKPDTLQYQVRIGGRDLYFNSYQLGENKIEIPAHYYIDETWAKIYKYCDEPITIVVPEGQTVEITDLRPQPVPYIVGGCK